MRCIQCSKKSGMYSHNTPRPLPFQLVRVKDGCLSQTLQNQDRIGWSWIGTAVGWSWTADLTCPLIYQALEVSTCAYRIIHIPISIHVWKYSTGYLCYVAHLSSLCGGQPPRSEYYIEHSLVAVTSTFTLDKLLVVLNGKKIQFSLHFALHSIIFEIYTEMHEMTPSMTLKHLTSKRTLYTCIPNTHSRCANFGPFRTTSNPFRDTRLSLIGVSDITV